MTRERGRKGWKWKKNEEEGEEKESKGRVSN